MSFKMKKEVFQNPEITLSALRKIYTFDKYPDFKSAYKVKRMCDTIETELRGYMDKRKSMGQADTADINALHSEEVEVKFGPLSKEEFSMFSFSPAELSVVEKSQTQ